MCHRVILADLVTAAVIQTLPGQGSGCGSSARRTRANNNFPAGYVTAWYGLRFMDDVVCVKFSPSWGRL